MSSAPFELAAVLRASSVVALGRDGTTTFAELRADVEELTSRLPESAAVLSGGGGAGGELPPLSSEVLIACADRYHFAVALLASWQRGLAVALPPSHRPLALAALAKSERVIATVHDGEYGEGVDLRPLLGGRAAAAGKAHPDLAPIARGVHVATLYTSGSTGQPQAVTKRACQLLGEAETLAACFGGQAAPMRVLSTVPSRHIYGLLFGVLLPLRTGSAFVRQTPLHVDAIVELLVSREADTLVGVPAHLQALVGKPREALGGLRRIFSSGAPLPADAFDALRRGQATRFAPAADRDAIEVIEVLGSTETGGIGYRRAPDAPFTPFPDVVVQEGAGGRMLLSSPRLDPALPVPQAMDDVVEVLEGGAFHHRGRVGDVVKVGGTRVSLSGLEQRIRALEGVTDVAVIAREVLGSRGYELLVAVAGSGWDAPRMRAALGQWLEPVALPRRFRFVSKLPREATGKITRKAVLSLFGARKTAEPTLELVRGAYEHHGDRVRVELKVPADLYYFRGHFDDYPILPGVVQLGVVAIAEIERAWPELSALERVRQLKFKSPIEPEEELELTLDRKGLRVDFNLRRGDELCSGGSLIFREPAERGT